METLVMLSLCVFGAGIVTSTSEPNAYAPEILSVYKNSRDIPLFRGKVREHETVVHLEPGLLARDNDTVGASRLICRYEIVSNRKNIPFEIEVKNKETGEALLKVKKGAVLSYEKRKHYKFNIFAYDCEDPPYSKKSNRGVVTVKVEGVDKFAPVFDKTTYFVEMEEDRMYDSIIKVTAHDDDNESDNKAICSYDILDDDVPFVIDNEGNLKNTEKISHKERYNFIVKVVARDCAGMVSAPAFINIDVKEICKNGWTDFPDHIEYTPGSGHKQLTNNAHLQICDRKCVPDHISTRLNLQTKHIGKGCDRDTYSITSQRKLCGANEDSVDLLPTPSLTSNWTNAIPTDDGHDGDKVYMFNGVDIAVEVPNNHIDHKLRRHFTISTWMKHTYPNTVVSSHKKGNKEHLLCMSDGDGMNRHHYALYVHNTKLVFVLRRESEDSKDLEVFKPAEWRWNLDQVNDGEWHHYAISMDFPDLSLYVDGQLAETTNENFEILDDWPLHPTDRVHFTKLVVGACWKGLDEVYVDHFQGFLAGLSILKDRTESERVIQCLNSCQESLDFTELKDMPSGSSVSFNKDMTEFSITGQNASDIETLVQKLAYVNYRPFPTPGRRNLNIRTSVHCGHTEEILPLVESYVFVQHSDKPVITIAGKDVITGSKEQLDEGMDIFKDLSIHVDFMLPVNEEDDRDETESENDDVNDTSEMKKARLQYKLSKATLMQQTMVHKDNSEDVLLDMCTIRAEPVLNFYNEHLDLPKDEINKFNMKLEGIETQAGLVIMDADTIKNYERVIRNIRYIHNKAEELYMRKFVISCSSQSARFVSNEFEVLIAPVKDVEEHDTIMKANIANNARHQNVLTHTFQQRQFEGNTSTNLGMVAIIVVCVGFLLFMIVLGVLRIRAAHNRRVPSMDERPEMEWDNSELNITVNPIDQELFEYEENPGKVSLPDDSDTDDDISECFHDDTTDDEDYDDARRARKTLEWDDSTLSY
ncbi:calsyntenin-1-like [Ruditapes philippinarum]|uniref:calsyntenin-1-like n=1 Tax=Ruditapes philippinarum TaxID=129788 RepID=UPI00295B643A|nr:calsyntenin-1-like [Ruditapes philippinarum]